MMKDRPDTLNGVPIPYDLGITELKTMMQGPPPQCWGAFVALGHSTAPESLGLLAEQLSSDDPYVRRTALEAIGTHAQGRELEQAILQCFQDPSDHVVRQACRTSASLALDSAHDVVSNLLDSPCESTRSAAIAALSDLWHIADADRLQALFLRERAEPVRKEAAWVLRRHANSNNCQNLFRYWRSDPVPRHRTWACELAAEFAMSDLTRELRKLADDPDGHVRGAALAALGRLSGRTTR